MQKNIDSRSIRGVKYVSLYEVSGYGNAARSYLEALGSSGIPLTWAPMVKGNALGLGYQPFTGNKIGDPDLDHLCNRQIEYDTVIVHTVPEYFPFWVRKEPGKRIIGYTVWETDRIPHHWRDLLNMTDRLLVPCGWNKEVFRQCGITVPIDIIPHIFEKNSSGGSELLSDIGPSDYVFYTIESWNARKSVWNTVKCYLDSFTLSDPALLVIKTTREDFTKKSLLGKPGTVRSAVSKILRTYRAPARIKLIDGEISGEDILGLHVRGDCYVSLCRSEGWGLSAFDAAGFGNPIIMTGFGGQLDYLPGHLAFLVNYTEIPVLDRVGRKSYSEDQHWAEPDLKHASLLMKRVFENREDARARGGMLKDYVGNNFNRRVIADRLVRVLTWRRDD